MLAPSSGEEPAPPHAVEEVSRRWRGGRRDDSARTRRKFLISTQVHGLETPEAGKLLLNMLLEHATSPSFTYFHAWEAGDVLIWDNSQTLHQSMPYDNDGRARREYYLSLIHI